MSGEIGGASPERTYGVVVGIERYDAGPAWDLDGPARDAARFAVWLLTRGVPADQLYVFLSPLADGVTDPPLPADVTVLPARRDPVNEVFTRTLPTLHGDLLWVFWAGHGVLTRDESRRLFYADASVNDKRNLDLTSLLTSLRSDLYSGLPHQIATVDSCQNYVERLQLANTLPAETFTYGQPAPASEQFVLYAASPGQVAVNKASIRSGAFSNAFLTDLSGAPAHQWPPDMEAIASRLTDQFAEMLEAGRADQKPTSFQYRTWNGTERVLAAALGRTSTSARPPRPSADAVGMLVDRLLDVDAVADPTTRAAVVRRLRKGLAGSIRYSPQDRVHLVNIVTRAGEWPGGLAELMAEIRMYVDPEDPAFVAAEEAAQALAAETGERE